MRLRDWNPIKVMVACTLFVACRGQDSAEQEDPCPPGYDVAAGGSCLPAEVRLPLPPLPAGADAPDKSKLGPCEIIWAKITNADLRGDRPTEGDLKARARELKCYSRPASIPHRPHPEVENLPIP